MSVSYWMIEGIGLNTDRIMPHLNCRKTAQFLSEQLAGEPDIVAKLQRMISSDDFRNLNIEDYLYGNPFDNLADILTYCDETDSITYGDDGEGNYYFYYPPSMPWEMLDTEPKSIREVHDRIIAAVQKITDLRAEDIEPMIDDELYVVGFG